MGNPIPKTASQVIGLATNMHQGLITLGSTLKITQITPTRFGNELSAFITAEGDFNAARSAKQSASDVFKPEDTALYERLQVTRNVLMARFGTRWSTMWAQAGFIDASTAVPRRIEERLALGLNLANFFTANPSFEVASLGVTAAELTALRDTAVSTRQAYTAAEVVLNGKGAAWDSAFAILTGTMRGLIKILEATLEDDDPRWLTFGLQMPSTTTTPGQPLNLTATLDETGALLVLQCDRVALATRYRWRLLLVGVETEYRLVARSTEPIATISNLHGGQTARIIVQAVNDDRQGVASEPIEFTMPLPKARTAEASATAPTMSPRLDDLVVSSSGNGSNGHRLPALS